MTTYATHAETSVEKVSCHMNLLRYILGLLLLPLTLLRLWTIVNPNEALVVICFGKLAQVITTPGCHPIVPWGCRFVRMSTKHSSLDTGKSTISDLNGNPVIVSAVVNCKVEDAVKAVFNVENVHGYVYTNAGAVLKAVVSKYPFESKDPRQPSLKTCPEMVSNELVTELRKRTRIAGVEVVSFHLSDLVIASEMASAMLVREQAQATLDTRHIIIDGVGIVRNNF